MRLKEVAPPKTRYAQDLATEKGCMWLTSLPLKEMKFNLKKRELRDGLSLSLCYDWPMAKISSTYLCGEPFTKGRTIICMRGGFVIQRHNELQHLEEELLNMVCKDVATEPLLQDVRGEQLTRGSNTVQDARLRIHAHGLWKPSDQPFLMSGFVTRMLNPIETSSCSVYIRMRKSVNNQVECTILNMEHSPLGFLQQLVDWERRS